MNVWNTLPREVVRAGTMAAFKGQLGEYKNRMGMEGYGLRKCIPFYFRQTSCSEQSWRAEGLVPVLYFSLFFVK